jgi:hypothetical protein
VAAYVSNVLLDVPDLGTGLTGWRLRAAERELVAAAVRVTGRRWTPGDEAEAVRGGIGLLVLEGVLVRRVGRHGLHGAEVLGPGDVLRPWQHDGEDATLPFDTSFRIAGPVIFAQLDLRFAGRVARYPEVIGNLVGRTLQRSQTLTVSMAIAHHTRVDRRLLMLLWHLADRWGRVGPEGVRVPLDVTHQVLADLVASRRPSVTTALTSLERQGLVRRAHPGWVLCGEPPVELDGLADTAVRAG